MYLKKSEPILLTGSAERKNKDRTLFPPPRLEAEAKKANCQRTGKNVGSNFILARCGLFIVLFYLLVFNLFGIIILKAGIVNTTITYYQIIENIEEKITSEKI